MSRYGSMPQALVVFRKELKDAVRDRRAIYSVLFGSLLGPLMVGFMMNSLADRQRRLEEITIPVVGMEYAPALVEWLRQQSGVQVVPGPEDAEDAVRGRRDDVVVVVPEDYAARFRSSKPVDVQVISDGSRTTSRPAVQRVRALLQRYSSEIAALRLIGRGVSPAIVTPVRLEEVEVSSAQQRAAVKILSPNAPLIISSSNPRLQAHPTSIRPPSYRRCEHAQATPQVQPPISPTPLTVARDSQGTFMGRSASGGARLPPSRNNLDHGLRLRGAWSKWST